MHLVGGFREKHLIHDDRNHIHALRLITGQ